jgi:hypothetical protein
MAALMFADVLKDDPGVADVHQTSALGNGKKNRKARYFNGEEVISKFDRRLKPMDEANSFSPFPYDPDALGKIRPDQTPRFFSALTDPEKLPLKTVHLDTLTATQNRVSNAKVQGARERSGGNPATVVRMAGREYIADGHHRLTAEYLNGKDAAAVRYMDLTPVSNALKDWELPFSVTKSIPDKQFIFGWASVVEKNGMIVIDKQGDLIVPEDLEAAAYDYNLNSRQQGHMHETIGIGRCIESMVFTKEKKDLMGFDFPDNRVGWWIGFKVDNEEHWQAHKRGELKEFSIGGSGARARV